MVPNKLPPRGMPRSVPRGTASVPGSATDQGRVIRPSRFLLGIAFVCIALSCSSSGNNYLRTELANRGPIPLSPSNPYLSANLFVSKEMERSKVLKGFIRFRGAPDAVEIKRSTLRPLRVFLFYLRDVEVYSLEESSEDWIIRGPEKIPPQLVTSFVNVPLGTVAPPLASEEGVFQGTRELRETEYPGNEPSRIPSEDPFLQKQPVTQRAPRRSTPSAPAASPARTKRAPARSADEAVRSSGEVSYIEESSSGDIIHRVTFPGESLRTITAWYTGSTDNTARIARINGIGNVDLLNVGQNVRIPRYLLRRTEPLPLSEVQRAR